MLKSARRLLLCLACLSWSNAYCQSNDVSQLISAVKLLIEAQNRSHSPSAIEWLKVGLGPLITLIVSGLGAWYLQRLGHRQAERQTMLESEIAARQSRNQILLEKELESRQWANQKLIEKRLSVFEVAAPLLNDLYCFMMKVGVWKEVTPPDALKAKRTLDRLMSVNQALFPDDLRKAYFTFIHACFETYTGLAQDAKLLPACDSERRLVPNWDAKWENMFSDPAKRGASQKTDPKWEAQISNPLSHRKLLKEQYGAVMASFASAVGAKPRIKEAIGGGSADTANATG